MRKQRIFYPNRLEINFSLVNERSLTCLSPVAGLGWRTFFTASLLVVGFLLLSPLSFSGTVTLNSRSFLSEIDTSRLSKEIYYYGKDGKPATQVALSAGPLQMIYEAGNLRYIRLGETEVVRMIYPTVRDRNWGAVLPEMRNEKIENTGHTFRITYENHYNTGDIRLVLRNTIEGKIDGTITYEIDGEALSTFMKNRLGICVIHPIKEHAGKDVEVTQPDGNSYTAPFPVQIQTDQLFKNIRTMSWPIAPSARAVLDFTGDVFETEDQRNFSDASFKTYCPPQERPKPAEVKQGDRIRQSVTLSLKGSLPKVNGSLPALQFNISENENHSLPAIGVGQSAEANKLSAREVERIRTLKLSHYRVDVVPAQAGWKEQLQRAIREANQLGLPMEVMLYTGTDAEAEAIAFLQECPSERTQIKNITVFRAANLPAVSRILKEGYPNTPVGTGANGVYMELKYVPSLEGAEYLSYAVNPQIHLSDNQTIVENMPGQGYTVESAKKIGKGLPIYVSPVTLRAHQHPAPPPPTDGQPRGFDVRQMSLFGAACTVGSLKSLAEAGAASATYYETVGTRGLMQRESSSLVTDVFKAPSGAVYPLYYVLKSVADFGSTQVLGSVSNRPLVVDGLVLLKGKAKRIILSNYTGELQTVRIDSLKGKASLRTLDESNVQQAMMNASAFLKRPAKPLPIAQGTASLRLKPYATAIIDVE
jgi:hypothetical protein